ncbi:hypothetical protein QCH21_002140 [Enterobacter bugandensis]|nr:hypothetical protein [Enterobacter bugandensis]EKS7120211.1 hypothetical protein [Enterobacter bugandensis]
MSERNKTVGPLRVRMINGLALTIFALLLIAVICWLALILADQHPAFTLWLALLQSWLQLWRLLLYSLTVLFWCYGYRQKMLRVSTYWQVRRVELLILMLWVTIEGGLWARSITSEVVL